MELKEPVVVYTAASNLQAHEIAERLLEVSIPAHVVEDLEAMAAWVGGLNLVIHKPQVFVSRQDQSRAREIVKAFEDQLRARRAADLAKIERHQTVIFATCERCGEESDFPVVQADSVQRCPHCGAFLDVEFDSDNSDWDVGEPEPPHESQYYK